MRARSAGGTMDRGAMSSAWASASAHRLVPLNESTIYWEANPRWHTEMLLRDCVLCLRNGEAPCLPLPGARRQCSSQQCSPQQLPLKPVGLRQNWASAAHILQHRTVLIIGDSLAGQQYDAMTGNATLAWSSRHLTGVQNASTTNGETCVYGTGVLNPCILERRVIEPLQTAVQFIRHSVTALPPGFDAEIRAADWLILGGWHKSKRTMPLPRDAPEKLLTSALKLRGTPARILLTEDVGAAFPGPWWKPTKQCANSSNEGMNQGLNARIGELAARYADRGVGIIPLYARFKERGDARKGPITRDNRTDAADCLHFCLDDPGTQVAWAGATLMAISELEAAIHLRHRQDHAV